MPLTSGARLGPYEIVAPLGAGGMGEVYRARDSKLNRDVAIKILPEAFVNDPERIARFEREAQLLASLNHPNIAQVYGLDQGATSFIVMELVDGEDLSQKLEGLRAKGLGLPIGEALAIAREIISALEAAHDHGIVHRDLKPANIALTKDGQVKILDFGLAKFDAPSGSQPSAGMTQSPTLTFAGTQLGVVLGTAAYMSPEQAKGRAADKRSDVWAFGCVLFEMLTAKKAFAGDDVSDTLAAILRGEPDWNALPAGVPPHVRTIIRRCLDKDRRTRIPDMSVVRFLLADASAAGADGKTTGPAASVWTRAAPWAVAGALGVALLGVLWSSRWRVAAPPPRPVTRFTIAPPGALLSAATSSGPIAVSPDGTRIAFIAQTDSGTRMVLVREMDQLEARPLRETGGLGGVSASGYPFFSPDSRWIGYVAGSAVMKVPAAGGPPATICRFTGAWRGATWLPDDTIVFGLELQKQNGLFRVAATGGTPAPLALVEKDELVYRWPEALPGGKAIIFNSQRGGDASTASVALLRLDTNERRVLVEGGSYARFVSSGHIVFGRAGVLMAVPFDMGTLAVTGPPVPVLQKLTMAPATGQAQYAVSASGTLVYASGDEPGVNLVWVDRQGRVEPIAAPPQSYEHPRLSPDGQRLAVAIRGYGGTSATDVWVYQFARGTLSRLTFGPSENEAPVWTPDGARVTYAQTLADQPPRAIASKPFDNSGAEDVIARGREHLHPLQWNPGGDVLLLNESASSSSDSFGLFVNEQRTIRPIAKTPFKETSASFSPDGRWMAYASDETGRFEIYAQAFPGPGGKSQISVTGGVEPVWARSGHEMFFRDGDKMMVVPIAIGAAVTAGTPKLLFQGRYVPSSSVDRWYDVSPDGQRFIMLRGSDPGRATATVTVVQEWGSELKRLAASKP